SSAGAAQCIGPWKQSEAPLLKRGQFLRGEQREVRLYARAVGLIESATRCALLPDDDRFGDLGALRLGTFVNDLLKKPSCTSLVLALDARDSNEREAHCARKPRYPSVCHRSSSGSVPRERRAAGRRACFLSICVWSPNRSIYRRFVSRRECRSLLKHLGTWRKHQP